MSARLTSFCLPLVLRRCVTDRLNGAISISATGDAAPTATIHVRDASVVFATSRLRDPQPGELQKDYVAGVIRSLADLRDVNASFSADEIAPVALEPVPVNTLLLEATRAVTDDGRVREWLGDDSEELAVMGDPFSLFEGTSLKSDEGFFLSRLDRPASIAQLLEASPVDRAAALRVLCALRFAGGLAPTRARSPWVGDLDPFAVSISSGAPQDVDMADVARVCYRVEEKMRDVEGEADYYVLLEIERKAPADRIKASYRELAKTFHPDRHAQLAAFDADVKSRLEIVFTALTNAYSTLGNGKEREAYDLKLQKRDQKAAVSTPQAGQSAPFSPQPGPRPSQQQPKPQQQQQRPSPSQPSPPPRPQAAPSSAPKPPEPKRDAKPARPPLPKPIVPPLPVAPPSPPPRTAAAAGAPVEQQGVVAPRKQPTLPAEQLFEHGLAYAQSGDFERAAHAFKRGVALAPTDARMHAALGRALANLHGLDKAAEGALHKAAELNPDSPDLFVELALVYQQFDRPAEAQTLFKRAYRLDPTNEAAVEALNDRSIATGDAGFGFLKKLFNRK